MAAGPESTSWLVYQPLVVGLGAVVLATLGNTLLEWFRHSLSIRHTAAALRRGLTEELRFSLETAKINKIRAEAPDEGGAFLIPLQEAFPFYDHNVGTLGLLRAKEIASVVHAYAVLRAQIEVFSVMGTLSRIENAVLHATIDAKWASVLAEQTSGLIETLENTVELLEGRSSH